jgi:hypothetical protein
VQAELALAKGNPAAAIAALRRIPQPWPAPLAAELLLLRGRAEFQAGDTLAGIRSLDERGRLLGAADARTENDRLLVDSLQRQPGGLTVPSGASDEERAWIELAAIQHAAAADEGSAAERAAEWRDRYPNHRGSALLPSAATAAEATALRPGDLPSGDLAAVALLLPLSGRQQSAGIAVRDGFLAGCLDRPGLAPRVLVYDTNALGASAAYQAALAAGARLVVGPLTKEDVAALAAAGDIPVPTLALNTFAGASPPPLLFRYALDPEQEARAAAARIAADGHVRGIALFPLSAWGERVRSAFVAELQPTGVALMGTQSYEPGARDFSGPMRAALGRFGGAGDRRDGKPPPKRDPVAEAAEGPQFAFVAASAAAARALAPQLRFQMTYEMPIYSTSDAWDPSVHAAADLDGLVFPEMPWILYDGQGAIGLWDVLHREWAGAGRGRLRLYAFGYDAQTLAGELKAGRLGSGLDGLTGRLTIEPDGSVQRSFEWARVAGGRLQPAGAVAVPAPLPSVP